MSLGVPEMTLDINHQHPLNKAFLTPYFLGKWGWHSGRPLALDFDDNKKSMITFFTFPGPLNVWYMGVSNNSGTPKWMVYNGKPY